MDPETGAGQASARCSAMKASIWAATWVGKGAVASAFNWETTHVRTQTPIKAQ